MPKCNFNEVALQFGIFSLKLLHISRLTIYKNTFEGLLLKLRLLQKDV